MALITPATLRLHVETDLTDAALTTIIAAEEEAIVGRYGDHASVTEQRFGGTELIVLGMGAQAITSVTEDDEPLPPEGGDAGDYWRLSSPALLERIGGPWGSRVTVVYVPVDQSAGRTLALINLCKLQLAYSGYSNQNNPDGGDSPLNLSVERERILRALGKRWVFA